MITRNSILFWLIIIRTLSFVHSSILPFNLTNYLLPKVTIITESRVAPQPPHFLQKVLDAIAHKEKWEIEDIKLPGLNISKIRYHSLKRYEFPVSAGKNHIVLKMYGQPSDWKTLRVIKKHSSSIFESLFQNLSKSVIDSFEIDGPLELQVIGSDDQLSIILPLNSSHSNLRRILVGEGITLQIKGAEEISTFLPSYHNWKYGISPLGKREKEGSIWFDSCTASPAIRISGSASVVAFFKQRPSSTIKTNLPSEDTIELLPEKCFLQPNYKRQRNIFNDLRIKISLLEKILRSILLLRSNPESACLSLRSRIRSSTVVHFHLELERGIRIEDTLRNTLAEWRTKPSMERALFEVAARIEGDVLKPKFIKRVRPFVYTDSFAWNSIITNLSFTEFPSMLVPQEALTLDVKW